MITSSLRTARHSVPQRPCHETDLAGIHCARPSRAPGTLGYLLQQLSDEGRLYDAAAAGVLSPCVERDNTPVRHRLHGDLEGDRYWSGIRCTGRVPGGGRAGYAIV